MARLELERGADILLLEVADDLLLESTIQYPTDHLTRVTSLTHRYNRDKGEYNLIIGLGEVAADYSVPGVGVVPKSSSEAVNEETTQQVIAEALRIERLEREQDVGLGEFRRFQPVDPSALGGFRGGPPLTPEEAEREFRRFQRPEDFGRIIPTQAGAGIRTTPEHHRILAEFADPMRLIPRDGIPFGGPDAQFIQDILAGRYAQPFQQPHTGTINNTEEGQRRLQQQQLSFEERLGIQSEGP